jgi:hypothetical protein
MNFDCGKKGAGMMHIPIDFLQIGTFHRIEAELFHHAQGHQAKNA